jgi:hypothetical protein
MNEAISYYETTYYEKEIKNEFRRIGENDAGRQHDRGIFHLRRNGK